MKTFIIFSLLVITINGYSQYTREEAIEIVATEVVGIGELSSHHLYSKYNELFLNDTLWLDNYFEFILCPFEQAWVFFVDDAPLVHWAHPCRIVWFNSNNGSYVGIEHNWRPPFNYLNDYPTFIINWEWILTITNTNEETVKNEIIVFPNPCQNLLTIELNIENAVDVKIQITDMLGKIAGTISYKCKPELPLQINTSEIENGIYSLAIYQNNELISMKKIIINH